MSNFLPVDKLDFASIKDNIKTYLKSQSQFKDYDFEGSNLSVLIDLLAYNTYMNSFYLNMVGNEMFLDSALLRESVVSHAKELNYIPRSYRSAKAEIQVQIDVSNTEILSLEIPRFTRFNATEGNTTYTFSTNDAVIVARNSDGNFIANCEIYQGRIVREFFTANTSEYNQRFLLSNKQIDTDSIAVVVYQSNTDLSDGREFFPAKNIYDVTPDSEVYYLQAAGNDKYEITFGIDQFGKGLSTGNYIQVDYRVSSGEDPNGANNFSIINNISGYPTTVRTLTRANGGAVAESIASIKHNAPRFFSTQDRAITAEDYRILVESQFPYIRSVAVYGGETIPDTPRWGRVLLAATTTDNSILTPFQKDDIKSYLLTKCPLAIEPEIVDPDYLYLKVNSTVNYQYLKTSINRNQLATQVKDAIKKFNIDYLSEFNRNFRMSKFTETIDDVNKNIISNDTDILMIKRHTPLINTPDSYTLEFGNAIITDDFFNKISTAENSNIIQYKDFAVTSTIFIIDNIPCRLGDDGINRLFVYTETQDGRVIIQDSIGTINYETGRVIINGLRIDSIDTPYLEIIAKPANKDILTFRNNIILIDEEQKYSVKQKAEFSRDRQFWTRKKYFILLALPSIRHYHEV